MSAALQVYHQRFDLRFFKLPVQAQAHITAKIDQMGARASICRIDGNPPPADYLTTTKLCRERFAN